MVSADFHENQKLEKLLFQDGKLYDKENDTVRTTKVNYLFHEIVM